MGFFDRLKGADINEGVRQCRETENAVLLDVRDGSEYAAGHIPGSVNLPLAGIDGIAEVVADRERPIFTYCLSGGRSGRAAAALKAKGYTSVTNIGGIRGYEGELEK
ncbi:MAG: rhodanese-like domain-containing protein [Bacillota bacterium]|jgi:phage shock protein E